MALQVQGIIGPLIAGVVFNAFLFGICMMQLIAYLKSGFKDRLAIKLVVYWVIMLDTFHTISLSWMLWVYVVKNFNNPAMLSITPWPFPAVGIITACTSVPIQHVLAWRIKHFTASNKIFMFLCFLSLAQGAFGIVSGSLAVWKSDIAEFYKIIPTVDAWMAISVVCDVSITCVEYLSNLYHYYNNFISYFLATNLNKSRTGYRPTNTLVTKIIVQSIEIAVFPLISCVLGFVAFSYLQDTTFYLVLGAPMGRIYTNTLLLTLNSRTWLRKDMGRGMRGTNIQLSNLTSFSTELESGTKHECISRPKSVAMKSVVRKFDLRALRARDTSIRLVGT